MIPLYVGTNFGWFHPARGGRGVILCPAIGVEDLCLHRFVRQLATRLAAAGLPTLRIDYHGTGDSAGADLDPDRVEHWLASIRRASDWMRAETGVCEVALVGFRVGALLAAQAAAELGSVKMLALLAAPASGKSYLRELRALSIFIEQAVPRVSVMRVCRREVDLEVGGFPLTRQTTQQLAHLDPSNLDIAPAERVLLLNVADAQGDTRIAGHLRERGCTVEMSALPGYAELQWNSSLAYLPPHAFDSLVAWLSSNPPSATSREPCSFVTRLDGSGWCEAPVVFGRDAGIFGVLCTPSGKRVSRALLFLNHGSNHHIGWARSYVRLARRFAPQGIASLRIDVAGLGDSPAPAGVPENQVYYSGSQPDVSAAINWLERAGYTHITVVGHCSGAHLAFYTAAIEPRIKDLVLVNLARFYWHPGDSLDIHMRRGFQPNDWYSGEERETSFWRRVLHGQINYRAAAAGMLQRMFARIELSTRDLLSSLLPVSEESERVRQRFRDLARRGTRVALVYSAEDSGLDEIAAHAGVRARKLRRLPGFSLHIIDDADHNLTAEHAFEAYARLLEQRVGIAQNYRVEPRTEDGAPQEPVSDSVP